MRPLTAITAGAASIGALVLTWNAGEHPAGVGDAASPPAALAPRTSPSTAHGAQRPASAPSTTPASPSPPVTGAPPAAGATPASGARKVVGPSIMTRYGAVQVEVDLAGTRIIDVVALHLTDSNRTSVQISARSAPTLRQEALAVQSAHIDVVSGATYTSTGYQQSLQAALDSAHA